MEIVNDNIALFVYMGLGVIASIIVVLVRLAWKRVDLWWTEQLQKLPGGVQQLYQLAAKAAAEYVEQLVESGQLEKEVNARITEAVNAGEKILRELGLKNADLDVLRIFIENYVREHLSGSTQDPASEPEGVF